MFSSTNLGTAGAALTAFTRSTTWQRITQPNGIVPFVLLVSLVAWVLFIRHALSTNTLPIHNMHMGWQRGSRGGKEGGQP